MSNITEYTYQHTCRKGHQAYILNKAPFFSSKKRTPNGKIKFPFLGEGYYLWEENLDAAIRWGVIHYKNDYCIVEYKDCILKNDLLLDFLNRRDIKYFKELIQKYKEKRPKSKNWKIAQWIEFLKKINKTDSKIFPFLYIRADENLPSRKENDRLKEKTNFTENVEYYTYLSPLLIINVLDKDKLKFKDNKIINLV